MTSSFNCAFIQRTRASVIRVMTVPRVSGWTRETNTNASAQTYSTITDAVPEVSLKCSYVYHHTLAYVTIPEQCLRGQSPTFCIKNG